MTDQLAQWVSRLTTNTPEILEDVHWQSRLAAEFWLSAFVKEVRSRVTPFDCTNIGEVRATAVVFEETVREFGLDAEDTPLVRE